MNKPIFWYAHDPMCAYCYAFAPVWQQVQDEFADQLDIKYLVGGLAPDSAEPMGDKMKNFLISTWHKITQEYGVEFNHDFFVNNIPRRSTYMACRAVLVAKDYQVDIAMIEAIQTAYYRQAQNPADVATLVEATQKLGINGVEFEDKLLSTNTEDLLQADLAQVKKLELNSFPSLLLATDTTTTKIPIDYNSSQITTNALNSLLTT